MPSQGNPFHIQILCNIKKSLFTPSSAGGCDQLHFSSCQPKSQHQSLTSTYFNLFKHLNTNPLLTEEAILEKKNDIKHPRVSTSMPGPTLHNRLRRSPEQPLARLHTPQDKDHHIQRAPKQPLTHNTIRPDRLPSKLFWPTRRRLRPRHLKDIQPTR